MGAGQWRSWTNLVTGTRSLSDLIPQRVLVHFDSRIMVRTMNNQQHKTIKVFWLHILPSKNQETKHISPNTPVPVTLLLLLLLMLLLLLSLFLLFLLLLLLLFLLFLFFLLLLVLLLLPLSRLKKNTGPLQAKKIGKRTLKSDVLFLGRIYQGVQQQNCSCQFWSNQLLVGGFNPFEKY